MRKAIVFVAAITSLALTGCSSSDSSTGTDSSGKADLGTINVGISVSISSAAFYAAQEKGYFADAGLKVKTTNLQSGSQAVPLLLNGQLNFSFADVPSVAISVDKGIPVKFVASANMFPSTGESIDGIVVKKDSPIKTPADLVGKTTAVNSLTTSAALVTRRAVEKAGGDPMGAKLVELPSASMPDAVQTGKVDAADVFEPFLSQAKAKGLRVVVNAGSYSSPGLMQTGFAATTKYLNSHEKQVEAFVAAITKANADLVASLNGDKVFVKKIIEDSTKTPAAQVDAMVLPTFVPGQVTNESIQPVIDSMLKFGLIDKAQKASSLVWSGK